MVEINSRKAAIGDISTTASRQKTRRHHSKFWIISLIIVLAFGLIATLVCIFSDFDNILIARMKYGDIKIESQFRAAEMIKDGKREAVEWHYVLLALDADNNKQKAEHYMELAKILQTWVDDPDSALEYATFAEESYPSVESAMLLQYIYQMLGDNKMVEEYSTKARERMIQHEQETGIRYEAGD